MAAGMAAIMVIVASAVWVALFTVSQEVDSTAEQGQAAAFTVVEGEDTGKVQVTENGSRRPLKGAATSVQSRDKKS